MNSKITCKTCSKENVPDWNGKGQCITCSRNEVVNSNEKLIIEETVKSVLSDIRQHLSLASMDFKFSRRGIEQILKLVESEYLDE